MLFEFKFISGRLTLMAALVGVSAGVGALFLFSIANAELPTPAPDHVEDMVSGQIVAMMSLERAVMGSLSTDRLAELGGVRHIGTQPHRHGLRRLFQGAGKRAAADEEASRLATAGQIARAGTDISPTIASFNLAILDAMPAATGGPQWKCMSEALYFEARGEDLWGQMAVAEVILNRVDSPRFPDNICAVVRDGTGRRNRCQFSYYCDGKAEAIRNKRSYARIEKIAAMMMQGRARVLTDGAVFYHNDAVTPSWMRSMKRTAAIGKHIFYRYP